MRNLKVAERRLAGSFFFSRKHTKRCTTGYFFATLAYQLATNFPSIRDDVSRAIREHPDLLDPDKSLRDQMESLFLQPLQQLYFRLRDSPPPVFVIDALDECTSDTEIADLISLLGQALRGPKMPVIHILLTSRSEAHIHDAIHEEGVRPLVCEIPVNTGIGEVISLDGVDVDNDIRIFLEQSFRKLRSHRPNFPQPTMDELARLASRAGRRFIVASTMLKFIDDGSNDPRDRLQLMLELTSELLPGTEVYNLYDSILSTCANPTRAYLHLSVVAALADPLPMSQISELLGPREGRDVEEALVQLRSIMDIPTDSSLPVNIYHSSVRDYVSDPSNCSLPQVQYISPPHVLLARSSLRLIIQYVPAGTALLDALSELKQRSHAMQARDSHDLKHTLSFIVQPPEPLGVLICLLWLREGRGSGLRSWLGDLNGRAWLQTQAGIDWLETQAGIDWFGTKAAQAWLESRAGETWLQTHNGQGWLQTQVGRGWLWARGWLNVVGDPGKQQLLGPSRGHLSLYPLDHDIEWLQTWGGQEWLRTPDGRKWLRTQDGRLWLQIQSGQDWLQTTCGQDWLRATGRQVWLQTTGGQDWLQTTGGQDWLQTTVGQDWLQITGGKDWLQTTGGQDWLQITGGKDWLQTTGGQDWLQITGGKDWLQTTGGQDWLQTTEGQEWLHIRGGEWLHAQDGRDWLQTQSGNDWLQTIYGQRWLQGTGGHDWLWTMGGQDWLQITGGKDWLQTTGGQDWLKTTGGQEWLCIRGGKWLRAQNGRDWLQTQSGNDWLQTIDGQMWLEDTGGHEWLRSSCGQMWLEAPGRGGLLQILYGKRWLRTIDEKALLQTLSGLLTWRAREWLLAPNGRRWLQTPGGGQWLQTPSGAVWLQTADGRFWLQTADGGLWLQTPYVRYWLQTPDGHDWLQTSGGRDWLQTSGGRGWLQTKMHDPSMQDWLQTQSGQGWLQTAEVRYWLAIQNGIDWLQSLGGRDWLDSPSGRDWLDSPSGRDWMQTPDGQRWQLTPAASIWMTMEDFSNTLEAINEYTIIQEFLLLPAFQVIHHLKSFPDFLMFPAFLALRHHNDISALQGYDLPDMDVIHAMVAFMIFAAEAQERSQLASDAVKYACQNCTLHLLRAPKPWDGILLRTFKVFWNDHLLAWLERQWCLKGLRSCLVILSEMQKLAKVCIFLIILATQHQPAYRNTSHLKFQGHLSHQFK
jgi:hypothetical protein